MKMETTARQLGVSRELPVHILYRGLPGRLGGENLFAKSIMEKYTTFEDQDLPSADFAYPESGRAAAEAALSELSQKLMVLNRIRIHMNITNRHILQRFSLSVGARCEQLLNSLSSRTFLQSGVSASAVRELKEIYRELHKNSESDFYGGGWTGSAVPPAEESTLLLRILTAASRGNSSRERYMRMLFRELKETGADLQDSGLSAGEGAAALLSRAERELFRTESVSRSRMMTIWASEQARQFFWRVQRAPEQERQLFLQAGGFSSVVTLEKVLRTMDDVTFRHFSASILERFSGMVRDAAGTAPDFLSGADSADEWRLFSITAGEQEQESPRDGGAERLLTNMVTFLESRSPEEWELFRRELVHADREGALKSMVPELLRTASEAAQAPGSGRDGAQGAAGSTGSAGEAGRDGLSGAAGAAGADGVMVMRREKELLFRVLREDRDAVKQLRILVLETIRRVSVIRENQKEYLTLTESIRNLTTEQWEQVKKELEVLRVGNESIHELVPADLFHAGKDGGGTGEPDREGRMPGGQLMIMQREKELLFRILREDRDAVKQLRILVLETIRRISVIRENQKEYLTLAESIMNLTTEQWEQMKRDLKILQEEDTEFRTNFPADMFPAASPAARENRVPADASVPADGSLPGAEIRFREAGIRMSAEKLVLLKQLQEQSLRPDSVLTETGRKLYIQTVLRSTEAGRLLQPSFRDLSAEGRDRWRSFMKDLMLTDRTPVPGGTAGLYFGRITERYGISSRVRENTAGEDALGAVPGREAALAYLEKVREERIYTEGMREERISAGPAPELTASADLTVPAGAGGTAGGRAGGAAARPGADTFTRSVTSRDVDIEFETVTRSSREENTVTDTRQLKELSEVLERHEREITKLVKSQEALSRQDVPKEVMRQLSGRLRMERLRGGL